MAQPHDAFQAIEQGNLQRLRELLAENPSLAEARSAQGVSIVLVARYAFQMELVELLLAHEPVLDAFTCAALGRASELEALLEHDRGLAQAFQGDGFTALQLACFFGSPECARTLLERGAQIEAVSQNGMELRALHAAAASKRADIVELVLAHGAEPNLQQHGGWTALHAAVNNADEPVVRALVARGADANIANDFGKTALDLAREKQLDALVRLLER